MSFLVQIYLSIAELPARTKHEMEQRGLHASKVQITALDEVGRIGTGKSVISTLGIDPGRITRNRNLCCQ